ncbi:4-hydroxy-tetrahydrodipicolinate synthase [Cupriavidus sp. 2KB_3]|uniref:4-hydroxy-tetrahydrodipicolinate synthase n=1 Tax=Cupriavidus TaxID=106589 RepID=UPI0011EE59FB|nr:4-hydroxy-tetrahydrodipicolinate synthase [Cupriavidus campinensis]
MQEMEFLFRGIWLPLVTPFRAHEVDYVALRRLVGHYRNSGLAGLVVCGSTGEAAALDEAEQLAVLDTVLAEAGDLPVVMGLAGNHLRNVLARLDRLRERPLAGVLTPAPYYIRPSQEGLQGYFRELADRSRAPLLIYDIPYRTGVTLSLETLLMLAGHGNIRGIKDCGGNAETTQALIADGRLAMLAGEDHQLLATLCMGGQGAIIASAHIRPDLFSALWQAVADQRLSDAQHLFHTLTPLIRLMFAQPNPGPVKALLARQGWLSDELRLPMTPASAALAGQLAAVCEALETVRPDSLSQRQ